MAANRAGDGLTAIRLAMIAVLVLFVLGPMLLDLAKVNRGSPAVNVMYDGRTYVRQTAGAEIAKYIPTKFAGKDRTDWVLLVGLLHAAGLVGSIRTRIDWAMQAGKDIIRELGLFNRTVKLIKTDFSVRCGVNAGFVYFDETTPLETMADRVIDVAGHMQKYADPNTVAVAQNIVEPLNDRAGFAPAKRVVDGYEVNTWRPAE